MDYRDKPRAEVLAMAEKAIADGMTIHFKFTCDKCGERCTLDEPNKIYDNGTCCVCGHETPMNMIGMVAIMSRGGGYSG